MTDQHVLLAIAIGPVQDFIAASRKARDLWAGSDLLSTLSRAAAESFLPEYTETLPVQRPQGTHDLIFPTAQAVREGHIVANKLLISTTCDAPGGLAEHAKAALTACLTACWTDSKVPLMLANHGGDGVLAQEQLDQFVEWYAAWVPYDPSAAKEDDRSYANARIRVERRLAGRKALRDFEPAPRPHLRTSGTPRFKSALDPSRDSLLDSTQIKNPRIRSALRLRENEHLDAISLLKRFSGNPRGNARFVSTSRVAIDPFIRAAKGHGDEALLDTLRRHARTLEETDLSEPFETAYGRLSAHHGQAHPLVGYEDFPFDSQLVYAPSPANARDQVSRWLQENEHDSTRDDTMLSAAEELVCTVKALNDAIGDDTPGLPAYYAVLLADGDRMGKAIAGLTSAELHRSLSLELDGFATVAGAIVRGHHGALIYAGGDDVLAFLPLDTALPCADALRVAFADIMNNSAALAGQPQDDRPTLSVGIAIGHYAEHLQVMLDRARAAEREAKRGRNALAVSFGARSGGGAERMVSASWLSKPIAKRWAVAIELHRHDLFPDGGAYELESLYWQWMETFVGPNRQVRPHSPLDLDDALRREVLRIVGRKQAGSATNDTKRKLLEDLNRRLTTRQPNDTTHPLVTMLGELKAFVDEVIIARRIARLLLQNDSRAMECWNPDPAHPLLAPRQPNGTPDVEGGIDDGPEGRETGHT